MVSFDDFRVRDDIPIYMQIILYIKRGIVSGSIGNGDELPSRRVLSSLLGVNPNTVQKAYRMLEDEGIVQSRSGAISYIVLDETMKDRIRNDLLESDVRAVISAMRQMGISKDEALRLIDMFWE
ncbi:MAG: GntR family transcriptional regulator [Clostridiales bacterium]|nr:GntR family transcriptional regulator [Clostridiales bacterium]